LLNQRKSSPRGFKLNLEEFAMIRIKARRLRSNRIPVSAGLLAIGLLAGTGPSVIAQTSGTWSSAGSMKDAREGHSATLLQNGQVLVAGGAGQFQSGTPGTADLASAELFKSSGWSTTGSMNTAREGHSAALLQNGQVLAAGGTQSHPSGNETLTSAELYNPATGAWTVTGSMNVARAVPATLLPNGQVLVAGGVDNNSGLVLSSAELYDPANGTWTLTGSMNVARYGQTATLLPNGEVLVAGGIGQGSVSLSSAELYNPATGAWTPTGNLNISRYAHAAVLLANGQPLVLDGISTASGIVKLNSTELYNPLTGTWTINGNTIQSGANFSVTLLGTGKVLIAGGITGVYPHQHVTNAAELYDPSVGTSVSTGSVKTARFDHSATLLPNGQVVVTGGLSTNQKGEYFVKSAEVYTP
jgi:N-acetylneuraminic acid mutarotase